LGIFIKKRIPEILPWLWNMTESDNIISVSNVTKSFSSGRVRALDNLSLDVQPGIFGLIGPNGAGKTTLLRILLGLARPDSGHATVLQYSTKHQLVDIRKRIGVLHEHPYYYPSMTAIRYLERVGNMYSDCKTPTELLTLVGLSEAAERKIGEFSAGMHQRLGLAQALVGRPQLVFLDEPTSNLDVDGRDIVISLLVDLYEDEGVSFFLSSHILSELERACHNVAFISSGKLIDTGPVSELVKKHTENRFKVVTSDSKKLSGVLMDLDGIIDVLVAGASTLIIEVTSNFASGLNSKLRGIADDADVEVFEISVTGTLEDVYRKVTKNG
jgi:ABC-2 type transport system ATP-binding protein